MVPVKLQLKNFLSYGPLQTIDFSPHHLICLSGKNGHGKSALLDAMTWALWGQARKMSGAVKADEKLVKLGHDQMMVIFDFSCNNQFYRVRREFSVHGSKAQTILDFGIIQADNLSFKPLTDKSIRLTQEKIETVLGLTYEGFINSAFLRQGQSNEFSKKSPQERKELLSTILGLDRYDHVRRRALELSRQVQQKKSYYQALIARVQPVIDTKKMLSEAVDENNRQLKLLIDQQNSIAAQQQKAEEEKKSLQQKIMQLHSTLGHLNYKQETYEKIVENVQTAVKEWRTIHAKYITINIKNYDAEKSTLEQHINQLQQKVLEKASLQEHFYKVKLKIHQYQQDAKMVQEYHELKIDHQLQELLNQHEDALKNYKEFENQLLQLTANLNNLTVQSGEIQKRIEQLSLSKDSKSAIITNLEKVAQSYTRWTNKTGANAEKLREIEQKIFLASSTENPSCSLCEQALPHEQQISLLNKFKNEQSLLAHQQKRFDLLIPMLRKKYETLKKQLLDCENNLDVLKQLTQQKIFIEEQRITLQEKKRELELVLTHAQNKLDTIKLQSSQLQEQKKVSGDFAQKNLQENNEFRVLLEHEIILAQKLESFHAIERELATLQAQRDELFKKIIDHQQIRVQFQHQSERKQQITLLCQQLKALKKEIALLRTTENLFASVQENIQHIEILSLRNNELVARLAAQKEDLLGTKAKLDHQQVLLGDAERELKDHQQKMIMIEQETEEYTLIAQAFGKDGIQALLIEHAIPDIEREANAILSRLTDNLAHISIESLRDLKSGGTKETLDIKISDAVGIRPYELYSGGEAFRIDFALRIAIAKLLARRAGASLQTLIIDEGFGSQDEEGLSHIMDALYKIQEDFAKIIIVSHLPTMKEQFPSQFYIHKGPQGSSVHVSQIG